MVVPSSGRGNGASTRDRKREGAGVAGSIGVLVRVGTIIVGSRVRASEGLRVAEAGNALSSFDETEGVAVGLGAPIVTDGVIVGVGLFTSRVVGSTAIAPLQALIDKSPAKAKKERVPIVLILT